MRVGLVAEGRGDLAVLVNILKGKLGLDFEDIQFIRPEYGLDETDLHEQQESELGGWGRVKRECEERTRIREFIENASDDEAFVVIQIDTAEAHREDYGVVRPDPRDAGHVEALRRCVVDVINTWLGGEFLQYMKYAVAVEETDAWVLTIHVTKDTAKHREAKEQLRAVLNKALSDKERRRLFQLKTYKMYDELTRPFRKARELDKCAQRNLSLRLFLDSL